MIAGLGNPGSRYQNTRHNAGFMLVDRMALRLGRRFQPGPNNTLTCLGRIRGESVLLAKPQTFMNRSGVAVRALLRLSPTELSEVLVVYDEFALPLGRIRLRGGGSAGGHNGMESVIDCLGTDRIPRLRIGIASAEAVEDRSAFVLSDFEEEEREALEEILDRASDAAETFVGQGLQKAMSLFNREQANTESDER